MDNEKAIIGLLTKVLKYTNKYEINIQFWPDQWAIYIEKDGIELTSFGGSPEYTLKSGLDYLKRITKSEGFQNT